MIFGDHHMYDLLDEVVHDAGNESPDAVVDQGVLRELPPHRNIARHDVYSYCICIYIYIYMYIHVHKQGGAKWAIKHPEPLRGVIGG